MAETINFTKAAIDALEKPATGKRVEYKDAKQPGLRLRVTSTGSKTFCVLKRIRGSGMERITLSPYPAITVEQARRKAAEIIGTIAAGENPAKTRRAIRAEPTFDDLFAEYGRRYGVNNSSWRTDQQRYRDYLKASLGNVRVSAVTTPMVAKILSDMSIAGKANATVNNVRALASVIFNRGIELGMALTNPVSATSTMKKVHRDRFIRSTELPRFFTSLLEEPNEVVRDYLLLSLLTGARQANVLAMKWRDISVSDGIWRIPVTKNGTPQDVTLSPQAVTLLEARRSRAGQGDEFVFPGDGHSGHLVEPKKGWKRIFDRDELRELDFAIAAAGSRVEPLRSERTRLEKNETLEARLVRTRDHARSLGLDIDGVRIRDLRIHDLRRTLGSWQAIIGSSLLVIGKSLNHKSVQTTAIYAHLELDPVRASVDRATTTMLDVAGVTDLLPTYGSQKP